MIFPSNRTHLDSISLIGKFSSDLRHLPKVFTLYYVFSSSLHDEDRTFFT